MSIAEAKARIDSQEFATWQAAYQMEPWGDERADIRTAILARTVASAYGGKMTLKDALAMFDLWDNEDTPPATPPKAVFAAKLQLFNAGLRGHARRGK